MHVIIVGCGRVGTELATKMDNEGHTVAIIDLEKRTLQRLPERFSGRAIQGHGFDRDILDHAGVNEADAFAAVTSGDNTNIVAARVAKESFNVPNVVARIYDPRRAAIYERLGIPTVASARWTTDQALHRLFPSHSATEWSDASSSLDLVDRSLPNSWAGKPLKPFIDHEDIHLVAVTRAGSIRIATDAMVGQEGDQLHIAVYRDKHDELTRLLENPEEL